MSSLMPYQTVLRYKAIGDQPRRTMLVLGDGQLKCLRVGDRTWNKHQLPTYPSLAAFLDIIPAQLDEEFAVEWGNWITPVDLEEIQKKIEMQFSTSTSSYHDSWELAHSSVVAAYERKERAKIETVKLEKFEAAADALGLCAGESAEGGYIFFREWCFCSNQRDAPPALLARAPASDVDYGGRMPGGMTNTFFSKQSRPSGTIIAPPPWLDNPQIMRMLKPMPQRRIQPPRACKKTA